MLDVNNLSVDFGSRQVIKKLTFQIKKPNFLAICGHNGSGKTSLFNAIRDKIKFSGIISLDFNSIGYLPQFNDVGFPISVKELLLMGKFRSKHFLESYSKNDIMEIKALLESIGMSDFINRDFSKMSGGEQQLVWILQVLSQELSIYLFDEPTQHLDIKNKRKVFTLLQNLAYNDKKLILCITHDLSNLKDCKGYLLNLSKPAPSLESISTSVIEENIAFLEDN